MLRRKKIYLSFFILMALGGGWIGVLIDSFLKDQPEEETLGMLIWLVSPLLTVLVIRLISRDWEDMGMKFRFKGNSKWYLFSFVIYPIVTVLTVGLALMLGEASISSVEVNAILSIVVVAVGFNIIKNIFEEFSWRGYLTPKLIELKLNDWFIYLITGLVWALWHAPYYFVFLPDIYFETYSRAEFLLLACVISLCWTVMFVELYRLTKSVWPVVLIHAVEDGVPTTLVTISGIITLTKAGDIWLNPTTGVITTILFTAIGLYLRKIRIKKERLTSGMTGDKELTDKVN